MEAFECSVDICDQDWTSFVAECEECNLLPPSLARLDDSGMSDIDDKVGFVQKVELAFSELDPPRCEDSPADRYLCKHGVTGMESILSGSEEDIHLQSVNVFFERLKSASEAEKLAAPNQTRAPTQRDVKQEAGHRSDGQRANNAAPMENIPNINFLAAASDAAAGETTEPINEDGGGMSTTPGGNTSGFRSSEPVGPEELKQAKDSADDEVKVAELRTPLNIVQQEEFPPKKGFTNSSRSHVDTKWKDAHASLSDSTDTSKTASRESSPLSSVRRKRAKKRRAEPAETQVWIKPSDSEEEQHARRGGLGLPVAERNHFYALKVPQRHATSDFSTISSLPVKLSAREIKVKDPSESQFSESIFRRSRFSGGGLNEDGAGNDPSLIPLNQTVVSVLNRSGHVAQHLHPARQSHLDEEMIHMFCCENEQQRSSHTEKRSAANSRPAGGAGNPGIQWPPMLTDQYGSRLGQSCPSLSRPDSPNAKSNRMDRTKSTDSNSLPDRRCLAPYPPHSDADIPARPPVLLSSSDLDVVSGGSAGAERAQTPAAAPPDLHICEHSLTSLTDITPVSSCCTLDTESGVSLSNGTITDLSYSSCLSVSQNDSRCSGEKPSPTKQQEEEERSAPEADDAAAPPKAEGKPDDAPDSTHSVFAMSSFWSEMEKLTINDILGLRKMEQTASLSAPPPVEESEKPAEFVLTDSGLYTDALKPGQTGVAVPSGSRPLPVGQSANSYSSMATATGFHSSSGPTSFRRICKTVSMQNLCSLESVRLSQKDQTLPSLDEEDLEKVGRFPDGPVSDTEAGGYSVSLGGIFQYIFGKQSAPQRYTGGAPSLHTEGYSLAETYDHFMSDCNADSTLEPLVPAQARSKGGSRSASRTLEFPEAYEYFFASSSSDESAAESDGEEDSGPARVVGRLRRTSNASELSTDIYDNFFTDCDFEQSSFWTNTFSFRNLLFSGSTEERRTVSGSFVPQRPSGFQITVNSGEAPDNEDWMFSDLYPVEDGLSHMLPPHPFTHEDLQVAVPSPRLDAPLLPLKQSDMCLVCIAFASWVLKTANPQVGDAWKAVLLANVSALSAIRYLRKYVKDTAASEDILHVDS
ncbi:uncharacterized protein perm1a [Takifugu rubripes]|uniref:uncharacterized protein perm1a n=1 Tax=Takifugu rubripes TaxID=31033 RepID=UPI001145EE0C|nr:PGC-1 and ERR-induced regulator in muscle protein 1 [Takifugu rubripes]XP_029689883.1 PGC-1 and ERR-induced regulator in muscle protein 1 [Takifugu rubripes]XP_029689884.1 PGC-1 and ERR-induced regulator in muscle protein 1 [Takifugu rubripes]